MMGPVPPMSPESFPKDGNDSRPEEVGVLAVIDLIDTLEITYSNFSDNYKYKTLKALLVEFAENSNLTFDDIMDM